MNNDPAPRQSKHDPHKMTSTVARLYDRVINREGLGQVTHREFEAARSDATKLTRAAAEDLATAYHVSWSFSAMPSLGDRSPSVFTSSAGSDGWLMLQTIAAHVHGIVPGLAGAAIASLFVLDDLLATGLPKESVTYRCLESLHAAAVHHATHHQPVRDQLAFAERCVVLGSGTAGAEELASFPPNPRA